MEYVKHKYSKRVYRVMTDHGPEHPYLSYFPYVRNIYQGMLEKFFSPCEKPSEEYKPLISVSQEIEWEKRQLRREEPIVVKAPPISRPKDKREKPPRTGRGPRKTTEEYTLAELCGEIGMDPAKARKLLRAKGKKPPEGTWKWPNPEAAKAIKRFLKKS